MNRTPVAVRGLLILAASLGASTGFAANHSSNIPPTWANEAMLAPVSGVSRAEVRADLEAARRSGALNAFDSLADLSPRQDVSQRLLWRVRADAQRLSLTPGLTRAEVRAELDAARRSGELNPFDPLADLSSPTPR